MTTATAANEFEIALMIEQGRMTFAQGGISSAAMNNLYRSLIEGCQVGDRRVVTLAEAFNKGWTDAHIDELKATFPDMYA